MLRLLSTQTFYELWKCSHRVASCVIKRKVVRFPPVSSACHHLVRLFNTGTPVCKDALQPKSEEMQTVDLDKWKSVMRSKAASEDKQHVNEEEEASDDDDDENLKEPGSKESSSLEATRELVTMWREAGKLVPQEMTDEQVQSLAELTTKSSRKKYLKYLAIREGHKMARKAKQQKKKTEREASIEQMSEQDIDAEEGGDQRGPGVRNTFFLQFWERSMEKVQAWRSAQAMMFGQPLVFDMSYESNMSRREIENTVSQLLEVEGWNRRSVEPFHLHLCNLQPDGFYKRELLKRYGGKTWDRLLITSTERQHVDVFPPEQLVYLTADSRNVLRTFDHSKVYVIGALVDRSIQSGLSLANSKRLKLATARLPLDEFLHWETGAKNLTLDQMIRIMLTLKETGKWEEALQFVPKRKHDGFCQPRKQKEMSSDRARRVTHSGRREDGDTWMRSGERTFKNEGQSISRSHKQSGITGRDRTTVLPSDRENKAAASRIRTSFTSAMEGRKGGKKSKMWWEDK